MLLRLSVQVLGSALVCCSCSFIWGDAGCLGPQLGGCGRQACAGLTSPCYDLCKGGAATGLIRVLKFGGVLSFGGVLASSRCQCGGCRGHQQAVLCTACVRCECVCVWRRGARICCLQSTLQSMLLVVQDALHGTRVLLQLHGCICYVQAAISARSQHMCMPSFSLLCLSTVRWCVLGAWG